MLDVIASSPPLNFPMSEDMQKRLGRLVAKHKCSIAHLVLSLLYALDHDGIMDMREAFQCFLEGLQSY